MCNRSRSYRLALEFGAPILSVWFDAEHLPSGKSLQAPGWARESGEIFKGWLCSIGDLSIISGVYSNRGTNSAVVIHPEGREDAKTDIHELSTFDVGSSPPLKDEFGTDLPDPPGSHRGCLTKGGSRIRIPDHAAREKIGMIENIEHF